MQELNKLFKEVYGNVDIYKKQGLRQRVIKRIKHVASYLPYGIYRIKYSISSAYEAVLVTLKSFKANKLSSNFKLGPCTTLGDTEAYITDIDSSGKLYGRYYYYSWGGAYDGWHKTTWEPNGSMLNADGTVWERYSLVPNK